MYYKIGDRMKIFQILNSEIYFDMSNLYPNVESAKACYDSTISIVEAPDYVFPGWGYDASKEGDEQFIKPVAPEGWQYDDDTGTFWNPEVTRHNERVSKHAETSNDTLQALRKLREGDQSYDWQAWLDKLDAYNKAIEDTQLQETYPDKVVYPEYPQR